MVRKTKNKIILKGEFPCLKLRLETTDEEWELRRLVFGETHSSTLLTLYSCYKNGFLQWINDCKGSALQKFMSLIPNEIRDKIKEEWSK